ncbi:CSL zinc finger-domain-containing protein [Boeremia exigua]|uniref:CSL zinc finger-domain-containing protein n=1 Tax=Boeremia exigua TaxID=749465 RepID=UPI001E8E6D85|nr:CSL zinc finger-domain-containing protein [Boeremia exigua]KAH6612682.1 CSL zinc finger-domain-containing protein [Boeremia exigua]
MAYTKNYYHVLGLSVPSPGSPGPRSKTSDLRRAYRNALLAAHPDKKGASTAKGDGTYSVDDVKEAYMVLDDPKQRADYDNWALRNPHVLSTGTGTSADKSGGGQILSQDFILGLELLDLSDFEEQDEDAAEGEWTRACRCGDEKGFRILEDDLEDAAGRGEKEVLVGCGGCSLWVRVAFDVEES